MWIPLPNLRHLIRFHVGLAAAVHLPIALVNDVVIDDVIEAIRERQSCEDKGRAVEYLSAHPVLQVIVDDQLRPYDVDPILEFAAVLDGMLLFHHIGNEGIVGRCQGAGEHFKVGHENALDIRVDIHAWQGLTGF